MKQYNEIYSGYGETSGYGEINAHMTISDEEYPYDTISEYNTESATCLGRIEHIVFDNEFDGDENAFGSETFFEELYYKKADDDEKKEYFLAGQGFPESKYGNRRDDILSTNTIIIPLSEKEARKWVKDNLGMYDYIRYFGKIIKQVEGCRVMVADHTHLVCVEINESINEDVNHILVDMGINIDHFDDCNIILISTRYNAAVATHYLWKPEIRLSYNEVVETYPVLAIRYYEDQLDGERIEERVNLSKETIKQIESFIEDNLDEVNGLSDVSE